MRKLTLLLLLGALVLAGFLLLSPRPLDRAPEDRTPSGQRPAQKRDQGAMPAPGSGSKADEYLQNTRNALIKAGAGEENSRLMQERLRAVAALLSRVPVTEAVDAILGELRSGMDAQTGLKFSTGENGLESAPTWKVFLLDVLGSMDPRAAADYARANVFPVFASPDEWAISLRNVLLSYPAQQQQAARQEVDLRLSNMLGHADWRATPSAGMLEALDFLPQTSDPARHLPALQRWLQEAAQPRPDMAVQIALERSVVTQGDKVLPALAADPSLLGGSPEQQTLRASLIARADLASPIQTAALEGYLRALEPASAEAAAFFKFFPERRFGVAPGLASQPILPNAADLHESNKAALSLLTKWQSDPSMAAHTQSLQGLAEKIGRLDRN